jgi:hypothetical protein
MLLLQRSLFRYFVGLTEREKPPEQGYLKGSNEDRHDH